MFIGKQRMSGLVAGMFMLASLWSYAQNPIDINTASADVIAENLNGIGLRRAQAIVDHREKNGAFKSLSDLEAVRGVGSATLERNKDRILFE